MTILLLASCQNKSAKESITSSSASIDSTSNATAEQIKQPVAMDSLVAFYGKKFKQDKLFEQFRIIPRIKKIMGNNFNEFQSGWGDESEIKKDGEIVYASACKSVDCRTLKVLLVIDCLTNNLNVYIFNDKKIRTYEESNIIGLTETIGTQYEKLRDDQNN